MCLYSLDIRLLEQRRELEFPQESQDRDAEMDGHLVSWEISHSSECLLNDLAGETGLDTMTRGTAPWLGPLGYTELLPSI